MSRPNWCSVNSVCALICQRFESGPAIVDEEILSLGDHELRRESDRIFAVQSGQKQPSFQISPMQTLLNVMSKTSTGQLEIGRALTNSPARAFARDFSHFLMLRLNATSIRMACEPDSPLLPSGQNLAASLDSLGSNPEYRDAFDAIQRRVQLLLPRVKSVGVKSFRDANGANNE